MAEQYTPDRKMTLRGESDFTYRKPFGDQPARYEDIRAMAMEFALTLLTLTPPSREQSLALTKLEEVVFYANASIARNEQEGVG